MRLLSLRSSLPWVTFSAFAIFAACKPPIQNGGVEIRPGVAERLNALCRWHHGDVASEEICVPPEQKVAPARVTILEKDDDKLKGALAIGRKGDSILDNGEVVFVVDSIGPGTGFAESGGNLVDAADARVRVDELGQAFTYFGTFPRQALYDKLTRGVGDDGTAWIEVTGHELYERELGVTTRYSLAPATRALKITTTLSNRGKKSVALDLGDAVQWGSTIKMAPGKELGFAGPLEAPWVAGVGREVGYVLVPQSETGLEARNGTAWTNATYAHAEIAPGADASFERFLLVTPRGDSLAVATELFYLQGGAPGGIEIDLRDARGNAVAASPGGHAVLTSSSGAALSFAIAEPIAPIAARAPAKIDRAVSSSEAPPGDYLLSFEGGGRTSLAPVKVAIVAGKITKVTLALSDAGGVHVRVTDDGAATPAKIQVLDAKNAPVEIPVFALTGEADLPLAPGKYRLVASRGPEFTIADRAVDVGAGALANVELSIKRVVDTRGFVSCDFHQHTALSADSGVAMADRIAGNVAEGLECAVASEHNNVVDPAKIVEALGVGRFYRAIPGDEITSDASKDPFGHMNVFPLTPKLDDPRGGAVAVRDRSVKSILDEVHALPGDPIVQVNHPRAGYRIGYFEQRHFDRKTGVGDGDYDARFDALEVWSGRHVKERDRVLDDLFAMLTTSHPVTPTANTDTHGIVGQEGGYPRTFVAVASDDPSALDPANVVDAVRVRRDVVLSNGPFVTMRLGDAVQGGLVSLPKAKDKTLHVHIEAAPWVDVADLVVVVGGERSAPIELHPATNAAGATVADVDVPFARAGRGTKIKETKGKAPRISVGADTFVVAIVTGEKPLEPVLRSADPAEILPFAMTAPLWIDVDGDAKAMSR